ncbi:NB-ARC domain, LRR domain containing protein [Trema orientale]|uniref:NB-ARC domain, LRR domain containing protein n=1 Tax=Trema orientale TaxID=63057 RepID=A0A2P5E6Y2_TREOI|nr:NB-ARC domain, LRR domain containing protein [Trema orientale]
MAAALVGGAFLSSFVNVLIDRLASREFLDSFRGKEPILKLLKELETTLNSAAKLLNDAEEKLIKDRRVKKWLDDLKDTVYAADDLVYKIDTKALRKKQEGESQSSIASKVLTKLNPFASLTEFDKAIKPETEEILEKLKLLLDQKTNLGLENVENKKLPDRLIAPLVEESDVYGRDADKEAIVKLLLSGDASGQNLSVIPIVGMGGIGKTTLAQLVYNDETVNKMFDTKAWITVGDDKVDCKKVMKIVIQKVTDSKEREYEELYDLQVKLKEVLTGKKFLFVLDDVWDEEPHKWDVLRSSFKSGLHGSTILVTTRSTNVASIMKTGSIHQLARLSNDDGWRLFAKHASIDVDYSDLEGLGKQIVDKCNGLPLAIKSLGALLRGKQNKEEWNNILDIDIWELYERKNTGILRALWLSYHYLPSYLKPCFAYCAMFPKDYKFDKEVMISLWMAEGFLHHASGKRSMEEVGEEYFQDLTSRSFFQPENKYESANFVMHDLMHDLAIFVSGEFCSEMDDTKFFSCTCKFRHLSYRGEAYDPKKFEGLFNAKGLHTFFFTRSTKSFSIPRGSLQMKHLLGALIRAGGCLRVLSVSDSYITKLPDSIGDLKYLKYLDLALTNVEAIPNAVCNLYNLQTLLLGCCGELTQLPNNIGNLINLRRLHIPSSLKEMPQQIGKLKNLQNLNEFLVGTNSKSAGIKQLKELQDLHGTLEIWGLENVGDVNDVSEAELKNKKFISRLILKFDGCLALDDLKRKREILGELKPHANLKSLSIYWYPDWLPSLKILKISNFPGVVSVGSEFYYSSDIIGCSTKPLPFRSLEILHLSDMPNLRKWLFIEDEVEDGVFPCLRELTLTTCPILYVSLPNFLPSLGKLYIEECQLLEPLVPRAQQMDVAFPSLETLDISLLGGQRYLLKGGLPSSLKEIRIETCCSLEALDEETFQNLTSLEKLFIYGCDNLRCLPRLLPTSLSHLSIEECLLLRPRVQRETGEDWPIIQNIPNFDRDEAMMSRRMRNFMRFMREEGDNKETRTFVSLDGAKKRPFVQSYLLELKDESFGAFTAIDSETRGLPWSSKRIEIRSCTSVRALDVEAFQRLTSLDNREAGETGEDWPIIHNIPNLDIDDVDENTRTTIRSFRNDDSNVFYSPHQLAVCDYYWRLSSIPCPVLKLLVWICVYL